MKKSIKICTLAVAVSLLSCTSEKPTYSSFSEYPEREGSLWEMKYTPQQTTFALWAPTADEVRLMLFKDGEKGNAYKTVNMKRQKDGTWTVGQEGNLKGEFYAFNVKVGERWLGDTPGINAHAVGVNGRRAAIIDMISTNPEGWKDEKKNLKPIRPEDIVLYEMHHRDFSIDENSGVRNKGKFVALTEENTYNGKYRTGIEHLKELGVTHVHILPSYDFGSIDETNLKDNKYNWGYDPVNYNVPDGSYSTDPYNPEVRIKEFKEMVAALHRAGIRVVLDVVFNHTYNAADSNFDKTVPGYFYRQREDGSYANGSGCGNETASEREMMRRYMVEAVQYWMSEYHIDGFRFDLMGIHDINTMNAIREAAIKIDPNVYIYGEGWAAEAPSYNGDSLAMKANIKKTPGIAAFSDELRDGLRGPFSDDQKGGFLAGIPGQEESIKYGIVGGISHPEVDMSKVNYTKEAWADEPTQMISYVSCHDDMCLVDRLKASIPDIDESEIIRLDKLAQTAVLTSQGVPFIFSGEELLRSKKGVHNSYMSPDSINAIHWDNKKTYNDVFQYYKSLIEMRREHPVFHIGKADKIRENLHFLPVDGDNLIAYELNGEAVNDKWKKVIVILNARNDKATVTIPKGQYTIVCRNGKIDLGGMGKISGNKLNIPKQSAMIIYN